MKKRISSLLICIVFLSGVLLYPDYVNAKETEETEMADVLEKTEMPEMSDILELLELLESSDLLGQMDFSECPEDEIALDNQSTYLENDVILGGDRFKSRSWNSREYVPDYFRKSGGSRQHNRSSGGGKVNVNMGYDYSNLAEVTKEFSDFVSLADDPSDVAAAFDALSKGEMGNLLLYGIMNAIDLGWSDLFSNEFLGMMLDLLGDWSGVDPLGFIEQLLEMMCPPDGVGCYKPNIYVYSDSEKQISVQFEHPELLTKTIPEYGTGWFVTTAEDTLAESCLTDSEGRKYDYLFYESVSSKTLFQTTEGYLIHADRREEEFRNILSDMGFNEQEINDFCEFWTDKLEDNVDYVMYPQNTDIVNNAMPITINPQPEKVERIWFLFEEDYGQPFEEPDPYVLDRDGKYTVIEWGGLY